MSGTLDAFLPPMMVNKKPSMIHVVEERCANPRCRKLLKNEIKYTLRKKGKEETYCQACAKAILRPEEEKEESI